MALLKNAVKFKAAKKVSSKAVGDGALSTVVAVKAVKRSNERSRARRAGKK